MDQNILLMDGTELAAKIKDKEISPVEVLNAFLEQIDRVNPKVNAFCLVLHEEAMAQAMKAEQDIMAGKAVGPLHGVPIAIKDLTPTKGVRTTFGSRAYSENIPTSDAIIVERFKQAGAIVVGKTNTPEFAHGGITNNLLFGPTKNPWNTELISGGSSGGSGAAVATAMVPFAEGTDGGGSIRMPSSANGIYGLKPQFGRIPVGILETHYETLLHFGPMTQTVRDAALLLDIMAGQEERDPLSLPNQENKFVHSLAGDIKGWKVAFTPDLGYFAVDDEVKKVAYQTAERFEALGCQVDEIKLEISDPIETVQNAWLTLWRGLIAGLFGHLVPDENHKLTQYVCDLIENGKRLTAVEYQKAQIHRSILWNSLKPTFDEYKILITPTLAVPPFKANTYSLGPEEVDGKMINPYMGWWMTYPFNMTGQPAASIPAGFAASGAPIGMQIIGNRFREDEVLLASSVFEQAYPWKNKKPQVSGLLQTTRT